MSKQSYKLLSATVMSAFLLCSHTAAGKDSLTGNLGVTSNYIFRGLTQTNDDAAVSAGIDYISSTNFYAGVWTSSLGGGNNYELDLYTGYRGDLGGTPFDAGIITYQYPVTGSNNDALEVYATFDFDMFSAQVALTLDKENSSQDNDLYLGVATEMELKKELKLELQVGMQNYDDPAEDDYLHFRAALKKAEFVFAIDKNNKDVPATADDLRISGSWKRNFDL